MHTGITERAFLPISPRRRTYAAPRLWRSSQVSQMSSSFKQKTSTLDQFLHFRPEGGREGARRPDTRRSGRPAEARLLERPPPYRTPCRETSAEGQTSISSRNGDILSHKMGRLIEERIGDLGIATSRLPPWFSRRARASPIRHSKHRLPPAPTSSGCSCNFRGWEYQGQGISTYVCSARSLTLT